jgi:phage terminase large subunit-like protein
MKNTSMISEEGSFITKDEVFFYAKGRGQSPRGIRYKNKRPNLGIADDMDDDEIVNNQHRVIKVVKWLLSAFVGALALKQSRFIMVGNRIHPKGILAHMVGDTEPGQPKRKGLYHSKIFATQNGEMDGEPTWWQNFTKAVLQARFEFMGTIEALKEFFHKYVLEGKRFKNEWIHWGKIPDLKDMDAMVCYFDPSYKSTHTSDYKAVRFWGKKGVKRYLIKSFVRQTTITQAVKWMYDLYEEIPDKIKPEVQFWMEDVFLQDQFYEAFETEGEIRGYFLPIRGDKRDKPDKFARIESMTPMYERGHVIWNEEERSSPDAQNGLIQYMGFEKGSPINDDAPDADEGAHYKLNKTTFKQKYKPVLGYDKNQHQW